MFAARYAMSKHDKDARAVLEDFTKARSEAGKKRLTLGRLDDWTYRTPRERERFREALRNAGVPEGE